MKISRCWDWTGNPCIALSRYTTAASGHGLNLNLNRPGAKLGYLWYQTVNLSKPTYQEEMQFPSPALIKVFRRKNKSVWLQRGKGGGYGVHLWLWAGTYLGFVKKTCIMQYNCDMCSLEIRLWCSLFCVSCVCVGGLWELRDLLLTAGPHWMWANVRIATDSPACWFCCVKQQVESPSFACEQNGDRFSSGSVGRFYCSLS